MTTEIDPKSLPIRKGDQVRAIVNVRIPGYHADHDSTDYALWVNEVHADGTFTVHRDAGKTFIVTDQQIVQAHVRENGTYYDARTPIAVIKILEAARVSGWRLRLHYGNPETGKDSLDEWGLTGTIGRSMGPIRIPLMIASSRSHGGPGLLESSIVKIRRTTGGLLYQHPNYHVGGEVTLRAITAEDVMPEDRVGHGKSLLEMGYTHGVYIGGENQARFKSEASARRYIKKMDLTLVE
jgi:hypothetical protein